MEVKLVFLYFILILIIGGISYKKIKNYEDFFIAGRQGSSLQIAGSLLATILGSSAIIGSVDFAYNVGWAGSWLMLSAAIGLILLYSLLKYLNKFQGYNLPEILGKTYGIEVQKLASFIIPIAWIGIVASQIMGAAKIIMILCPLNYTQGVWLSGVVFIIYTYMGGQLSIIKTDFIQLLFILFGLLATIGYIGVDIKEINSLGIINNKFNYIDVLILILTYSTTCLVGPDIYSRLFCARDMKVMKNSIIIVVLVLIPVGFILAAIGIYGAKFLGEINNNSSILLIIAEKKLNKVTSIFLYFGLLSAVISSADTTLLTASSLFSQTFIQDLRSKKAMLLTRIMVVILGIFSIIIALYLKNILGALLMAVAIYSGAFIIPTLLGILGYTTNKKIVILAIIIGGTLAFISKIMGGEIGNYLLILSFCLNLMTLIFGKIFEVNKKNK